MITKFYSFKGFQNRIWRLFFAALIFTLTSSIYLNAQCPTGNLLFTTQAQVDNFLNQYPNCTELSGELFIGEFGANSNITNLQGFQNINSILGEVKIEFNDMLIDFSGLNNLNIVGGRLWIYSNSTIVNFNGLQGLTAVGGNLVIQNNINAETLNGLNQLETVGGFFQLRDSDKMSNLVGLDNLSTVNGFEVAFMEGFRSMTGVENLTDLGQYLSLGSLPLFDTFAPIVDNLNANTRLQIRRLNGLTNLQELSGITGVDQIALSQNNNLASLAGLENLTQGSLSLIENPILNDLTALSNFTNVENITIGGNDALSSLEGLNNIISMQGNLRLAGNPLLTNLEGLNNLNTIGGNLDIGIEGFLTIFDGNVLVGILSYDMNSFVDLTALSNLTSIFGNLRINDNQALTSLDGLDNLQEIFGTLTIENNNFLTDCDYDFLCNYFEDAATSAITILGNAPDCTFDEIAEFCGNNTLTITCPAAVNILLEEENTSIPLQLDEPFISTTCTEGNISITQTSGPIQGQLLAAGNYTAAFQTTDGCGGVANCSVNINITAAPLGCNINVNVSENDIIVSGLTAVENTKLFDANTNSVWECNPWNGSPCSDNEVISGLPTGNYFLSVQSDNCEEWIPISITNGTGCSDNDNDGFCVEDDCDDNNPNIPAIPGNSCNDNNPNTNNDVYLSDGCTCEGTPISSECNVTTQAYNNGVNGFIDITGLNAAYNVKLFDADFNIVWECNPWNENVCTPTYTHEVTGANDQFFLSVQSDNCNVWIPIVVPGDLGCDDADSDGTCDEVDCAPNDPSLPATIGSPCDDANPATQNDVIQANGCDCQGTPTNDECNINVTDLGNNQLTITGLSADANTKLFNASVSAIVWECNPWDAAVCSANEVIDVSGAGTQFFLSVQSAACNEWIPIDVGAAINSTNQSKINSEIVEASFIISKLFPNPGTAETFVSIESQFNTAIVISLSDVMGKIRQQNQFSLDIGNQTIQLNTASLEPGIYNITIQNNEGQISIKRFVKN